MANQIMPHNNHCQNCGAQVGNHQSQTTVIYARRDCFDARYDFANYLPPKHLLRVAVLQVLLALAVLMLGCGCGIHGIMTAGDDKAINCIDFTGCWMGATHCVFGFISVCILMSSPHSTHCPVKFVLTVALISAIYNIILVITMAVWVVLFFVNDRLDYFAIDLSLLVVALIHGCLCFWMLASIVKTAPRRDQSTNCTHQGHVPPNLSNWSTATNQSGFVHQVSDAPPMYSERGPQPTGQLFARMEPPPTYEMALAQKEDSGSS